MVKKIVSSNVEQVRSEALPAPAATNGLQFLRRVQALKKVREPIVLRWWVISILDVTLKAFVPRNLPHPLGSVALISGFVHMIVLR